MSAAKNPICPLCSAELVPRLTLHHNSTYSFEVESADDFKETLRDALLRYWRWKAEGELPGYRYRVLGKPNEAWQGHYDDYHSHVTYIAATDTYEYAIQTHDSPDGDTWVRGTFRVVALMTIVEVKRESASGF